MVSFPIIQNSDWINRKYPITKDLIEYGIDEKDAKFIERKKAELYAHILLLELYSKSSDENIEKECLKTAVKYFLKEYGLEEKYSSLEEWVYEKIGKEVKESVEKIIQDSRNINLFIFQKEILENYANIFRKTTIFINLNNKDKEIDEIYEKDREIKENMEKVLYNNEILKAMEILYTRICDLKRMSKFRQYCEEVWKSYNKYWSLDKKRKSCLRSSIFLRKIKKQK